MGFVVGYAPCGLSPQIDGMPVIPENPQEVLPRVFFSYASFNSRALVVNSPGLVRPVGVVVNTVYVLVGPYLVVVSRSLL